MKRIITFLFLLSLCVFPAFAVQLETGANGQAVGSTNPLAVTGSVTLTPGTSTATSIITASTGTQTILLLSAAAQTLSPIANRKYVQLTASGPFQYTVGTTTVIVDTADSYNTSFEADSTISVGLSCSGVAVKCTARQFGN